HGRELWQSDGTQAGTVLVRDITVGPAGSNPLGLVNVNGTLFFTATDGFSGYELWKASPVTPPANRPPVANAGGPYTVAEGGSAKLNALGSSDPDQPANTLTYAWDLDGDGLFGEDSVSANRGYEVGPTPTFRPAGLDGPQSWTVRLRVTDSGGLSSYTTATI